MDYSLLGFISLSVCAGAGAFLGSYLKRKGENLATHEDIDKVVDQVRAVTTATKEIEAKISSEVWDRQKLWELKREVLFEAMKGVALVIDALTTLNAVHLTEKRAREQGQAQRQTGRLKCSANGAQLQIAWNKQP